MRLGAETTSAIREAIASGTGGFIWYGTMAALQSETINHVEIPAALGRARRDASYPVVPLFVNLRPSADRSVMAAAMGPGRAGALLRRNGLPRLSGERLEPYVRRVARRYVKDAVIGRPTGRDYDLTIDWRTLFDTESRVWTSSQLSEGLESLTDVKTALQQRADRPKVRLTVDLPLPIALMIGYEWRLTTGLNVEILQPKEQDLEVVDLGARSRWKCPAAVEQSLNGRGPCVVSVAIGEPLTAAAGRYAARVRASRHDAFHVAGLIGASEIRSIARSVTDHLRRVNDRGAAKHLLIRGPYGLAVAIGLLMNAVGPTVIPFWDGHKYVNPLVIGGPNIGLL
jgi:hypothetical protein